MDENTPSNASLNPSLIPPGATTATGAGTATTASPAPTMENTAQQQQQMPINQGQLLLAQGQLSGTPSEQTQQQQQQMLPSQAFQVQQGLASQQAAGAHLQRTSSAMSRINSAQFSMRPTIYTQQQAMGMNFSPHIQQQAGGTLSRSALMSQTGHLPMLPGQATQFTNLQSQLLSQVFPHFPLSFFRRDWEFRASLFRLFMLPNGYDRDVSASAIPFVCFPPQVRVILDVLQSIHHFMLALSFYHS